MGCHWAFRRPLCRFVGGFAAADLELVVVGAVFEDVEGFDEVGKFAVAVQP